MSYALLGIRGLGGEFTSNGVDEILEPFAENADFFHVASWMNAAGFVMQLADFNGKIVIVLNSLGWQASRHFKEHLAGKDVCLVTLDPAQKGFGGTVPLVTPFDSTRHLNIWQQSNGFVDTIQDFDRVEGARNVKWKDAGHEALDDRPGVQKLAREWVADFLQSEIPNEGKSMNDLFYIGEGKKLTDKDIQLLSFESEIPEYLLRAVIEVEARQKGSHSSGALVHRIELHKVYKYSSGAARNRLLAEGLAHKDYKVALRWGSANSYPKLEQIAEIGGTELACLSCSWGMGQIMGFNHRVAGFDTAEAMVRNFAESERNQVAGMIEFIDDAGLKGHLLAERWANFAAGYNGASYRDNNYDVKLKKRCRQVQKTPRRVRERETGRRRRQHT